MTADPTPRPDAARARVAAAADALVTAGAALVVAADPGELDALTDAITWPPGMTTADLATAAAVVIRAAADLAHATRPDDSAAAWFTAARQVTAAIAAHAPIPRHLDPDGDHHP